ncbi:MAG: DUF5723 family protein [Chitinophagaceae bacterium]
MYFFNPANVADSRYRWDVNLVSLNGGIGNNNASFKLKNIDDAFSGDVDSLLFGTSAKNTNALALVDVFGPSVMFNTSSKLSFAITTRVRAQANANNIDGKFIQSIDASLNQSTPFSLSSNAKQKLALNGWTDLGATVGAVLFDKGKHFLKGGVTLKYVAGAANSFANINNFQGTVNKDLAGDYYLTNSSGVIALGYSGYDFDDFEASDVFKFNGHGYGADIGLVYEYRPDENKTGKYENKYKFKVGVSLLDAGRIKYKPRTNEYGSYTVSISGAETWYTKDLDGKSLREIKTYLDSKPALFTNNGLSLSSYNVKLPTTLQGNVDWNIHKDFFVDLGGQFNLTKKSSTYNSFYYNSVTLTPRYEGRTFGVYIPLNYNPLTDFNAGVSLRAGPFFVGSGSVLTALVDKSKQADIHFGIRFGSLQKKEKKQKETFVDKVITTPVDTDNDGVYDANDKCPTVAGLAKYQGCPVPDTDRDGINDEDDQCPTITGLIKYKGCPVPDTDNDGVNDEYDKCPSVPGSARYAGCPIPDTDGDGINDEEDRCPSLAGTTANHGCPEIKAEVEKKVNTVAKKILFQTGKSILLTSSVKQLDQLIAVLKQDTDLKLSVEGHTDNTGNADKNLLLSQKRADAVKAYLLKKGISETRISTEGFGVTMPIADNKTALGRTKNRRVELKLNY